MRKDRSRPSLTTGIFLGFIGKPTYLILVALIRLTLILLHQSVHLFKRLNKNYHSATPLLQHHFSIAFRQITQTTSSIIPISRRILTHQLNKLGSKFHQVFVSLSQHLSRYFRQLFHHLSSIPNHLRILIPLVADLTRSHLHHFYTVSIKQTRLLITSCITKFQRRLHPIHARLTKPLPLPTVSLPHITLPSFNFLSTHLPRPSLTLILRTAIILFLSSSAVAGYAFILKDLPHPKDLLTLNRPITTKVYARNGELLYKVYKNENRSLVTLDVIPKHVIDATIAIEDAEFYAHPGFSLRGIMRAFQNNLTTSSLQGGSTITQQLIKNTLLSPERTFIRKAKELVLAIMVESYFTKDEILTMYFNEVGYGGTAYGIEAASQMYFGKSVSGLNLSEAALIAGLPAAPTSYSPFGQNPTLAISRQHEVLDRMVKEHYISQDLAAKAIDTKLQFQSPNSILTAPHFVMYTKGLLETELGETQVNQGGLEVTTTLDPTIQAAVETIIKQEIQQLTKLNIKNAAAIVTRPETGEILAMVGSVDYFNTQNDGQVNVTLMPRQPGSSIKPLNYAMALESGLTPLTTILDAPVTYHIPGSPPYSPKNYDHRFHGIVTVRQALANSYNIPAVKTLNQFGVSKMVNLGVAMGITTWTDPSRFGLSLTLGGGEVTLADMAVLYGVFANQGIRVDLNPFVDIHDFTNKQYHWSPCTPSTSQIALAQVAHAQSTVAPCPQTPVIKPSTAFLISDILSDNDARSRTFGRHSVLNIDSQQVAVKTGTTNNLHDNWTIGYTKDYVVGVWVGNNDNSPMSQVASGVTGASPIWSQIMTYLLHDQPPHSFTPPEGIIVVPVCTLTNTLTCSACPNPGNEYFTQGTQPTKACSPQLIELIEETRQSQTRSE